MSDASNKSAAHYVEEIKNSWRSFRQLVAGKSLGEVETTAVATIEPETATLNSLAKVNEETRERCLNILDRLEELSIVRQEFIEVVGEVGRVLRDAEGTSSTLVERTALLTREEAEHSALKARYRTLHEESEVKSQQNDLLMSETQRFDKLVSSRESRIAALEAELAEVKESSRALYQEMERQHAIADAADVKLRAADENIRSSEALIAEHEARAATLLDRCSAAEFYASALEGNVAEQQSANKSLREALIDYERRLEAISAELKAETAERERLHTVARATEDALSAAQMQHEIALAGLQRREEGFIDDIEALRKELDVQRARAQSAETTVAATRAEHQNTVVELRAKARRAEAFEMQVAPLERQLIEAQAEIAAAGEKFAEEEKLRARLTDRAQALVRAMSDQKAKLDLAEERCALLDASTASEATRFAQEKEELQAKLRDLAEQLEKEKSAHAVAASALEAARSRRRQSGDSSTWFDILARADEAASGASPPDWMPQALPAADDGAPPPMTTPTAPMGKGDPADSKTPVAIPRPPLRKREPVTTRRR
jgi:chromosome segregation ATPase